jgi:hypothetical protein
MFKINGVECLYCKRIQKSLFIADSRPGEYQKKGRCL